MGMLIYDTRYRSMTIQVVALIGFLILIGGLIYNTSQNLASLEKEINFSFLWNPAGYDINQKLLDYNSQSPHYRAALVGVLNTLLVAFLGCITATIIGVLVGVLRLSNNWLVARIMTIYVEMFRNVPVLLWIVFVMAIMIETLPEIKEFRGDEATATMKLFGTVAVSNKGVFIPRLLFTTVGWLVPITFIVSLFGIRWLRRRADRIQDEQGVRPKTLVPGLLTLIVPALVVFALTSIVTSRTDYVFVGAGTETPADLDAFVADVKSVNYCHSAGRVSSRNGLDLLVGEGQTPKTKFYFGENASTAAFAADRCNLISVPASEADTFIANLSGETRNGTALFVLPGSFSEGASLQFEKPVVNSKGIPKFEYGTHLRNSLIALWFALSLYTAAFIAENVRAGILAVSKGQSEAAGALGLRPNRIMSLVVLPQALRVIIPPLISQYLNLTKNSSLAIAVGYMDVTGTLMGITLNQTGREMETLLMGMLIYLVISLSISAVMNWYNNRMKLVER